jgi:hypothetical protein
MARGAISKSLKAKSKELLGYEIDRDEYRLMPYVQFVMMNEQRLDARKVSMDELAILTKWENKGWILFVDDKLAVTKAFWDILSELLFIGYVEQVED